MNLNEQAETALNALLYSSDASLNNEACRIARMMWLDGYKAGMDKTKALADDAITKAITKALS